MRTTMESGRGFRAIRVAASCDGPCTRPGGGGRRPASAATRMRGSGLMSGGASSLFTVELGGHDPASRTSGGGDPAGDDDELERGPPCDPGGCIARSRAPSPAPSAARDCGGDLGGLQPSLLWSAGKCERPWGPVLGFVRSGKQHRAMGRAQGRAVAGTGPRARQRGCAIGGSPLTALRGSFPRDAGHDPASRTSDPWTLQRNDDALQGGSRRGPVGVSRDPGRRAPHPWLHVTGGRPGSPATVPSAERNEAQTTTGCGPALRALPRDDDTRTDHALVSRPGAGRPSFGVQACRLAAS